MKTILFFKLEQYNYIRIIIKILRQTFLKSCLNKFISLIVNSLNNQNNCRYQTQTTYYKLIDFTSKINLCVNVKCK